MATLRLALAQFDFPVGAVAANAAKVRRTDRPGAHRWRRAGGVSRADPQRLSAGGSAAAAELPGRLRQRAGGAGRAGPRHRGRGRSSAQRGRGIQRRQPAARWSRSKPPRTSRRCPTTACSTTSAISVPATRRVTAVDRGRTRRPADLRGRVAARAGGTGRRGRRRAAAGDQCLAVGCRQAGRARGGAGGAGARDRLRDRLPQPGRRPGRSGLRRRARCW